MSITHLCYTILMYILHCNISIPTQTCNNWRIYRCLMQQTHTTTKGQHKFRVRWKLSTIQNTYSFITYDDDDGAGTEWSQCRQAFYLHCIMSKRERVKSLYRPRNIQQYYLDIYNILLCLWFPNCAPQGHF